jgi:hypothetical protein
MTLPARPAIPLVVALALAFVAACSSELASPIPQRDGELAGGAGGETGGTTTPEDAGSSTPPVPPSGSSGSSGGASSSVDAGVPTTPVTFEAGPPVGPDASGSGSGVDSGPTVPPISGTGICSTPACATDGNECGCQATSPNGQTVQMGCQAGGECICLVDEQPTGQTFSENGACSDQTSTASQFVMNCQCQ